MRSSACGLQHHELTSYEASATRGSRAFRGDSKAAVRACFTTRAGGKQFEATPTVNRVVLVVIAPRIDFRNVLEIRPEPERGTSAALSHKCCRLAGEASEPFFVRRVTFYISFESIQRLSQSIELALGSLLACQPFFCVAPASLDGVYGNQTGNDRNHHYRGCNDHALAAARPTPDRFVPFRLKNQRGIRTMGGCSIPSELSVRTGCARAYRRIAVHAVSTIGSYACPALLTYLRIMFVSGHGPIALV
jgi:hypothetical protein